ncbi:DUF924 domain-containing protein [Tianweitania sp. BSSL-BM11]|uniref:DUF924 domain-containing protein n=1 Tax=Tianweitania aestuarii TaxID=2814886 RepID=A0ABS5S0E4_9HYPH|nr:DUF924 family protein [Tianweitania aestuarii]MBS9721934.1 DUF924 domain-containing protein [Tianweitania aestuarii]
MTDLKNASPATRPQWADDVLTFWFDELKPDDWFAGGTAVDDRIRDRFSILHDELSGVLPKDVVGDAKTALAAIIVLDQFSRNLFRGTAKAFASDDLALAITRQVLDHDLDQAMSTNEKLFLYLPLEHSEVLADGERCVALFQGLGHEGGLKAAIEHRDILARFGRYPHRNKALNRESTPQELAFLAEHEGFGQ